MPASPAYQQTEWCRKGQSIHSGRLMPGKRRADCRDNSHAAAQSAWIHNHLAPSQREDAGDCPAAYLYHYRHIQYETAPATLVLPPYRRLYATNNPVQAYVLYATALLALPVPAPLRKSLPPHLCSI